SVTGANGAVYGTPYVFFEHILKNITTPTAVTLKSIIRDTFRRESWKKLSDTDMTVQQLSGKAKSGHSAERTGGNEQDK
ncbi:hypothetical protein PZH37_16370, partial [[Eubacterium] siraeum]|nr:hypothetical protein [[Eubacterium] siraeum]